MLSKHFKLMTFWLQSFFSMPDSSFELFLYTEFVFNQKQDKKNCNYYAEKTREPSSGVYPTCAEDTGELLKNLKSEELVCMRPQPLIYVIYFV